MREKGRVCYLVYLLSEQLPKPQREDWRNAMLDRLDISFPFYCSKYKEPVSDFQSEANQVFAQNLTRNNLADKSKQFLCYTNCEELTNLAVVLFIGMAGGPASAPSGGGGGSSADNNWGRDKDEDDLRWARRCAKAAAQKLGKQPKSGLKR